MTEEESVKKFSEEELSKIDSTLQILLAPSHLNFPKLIHDALRAYQYLRKENGKLKKKANSDVPPPYDCGLCNEDGCGQCDDGEIGL